MYGTLPPCVTRTPEPALHLPGEVRGGGRGGPCRLARDRCQLRGPPMDGPWPARAASRWEHGRPGPLDRATPASRGLPVAARAASHCCCSARAQRRRACPGAGSVPAGPLLTHNGVPGHCAAWARPRTSAVLALRREPDAARCSRVLERQGPRLLHAPRSPVGVRAQQGQKPREEGVPGFLLPASLGVRAAAPPPQCGAVARRVPPAPCGEPAQACSLPGALIRTLGWVALPVWHRESRGDGMGRPGATRGCPLGEPPDAPSNDQRPRLQTRPQAGCTLL